MPPSLSELTSSMSPQEFCRMEHKLSTCSSTKDSLTKNCRFYPTRGFTVHAGNLKAVRSFGVKKKTCVTYVTLGFSKLVWSQGSLLANMQVDTLFGHCGFNIFPQSLCGNVDITTALVWVCLKWNNVIFPCPASRV